MRKRIKEQPHKVRVRRTAWIAGIASTATILGVMVALATAPAALAAQQGSAPMATATGIMTTVCKVNPKLVSPAILANPANVKALCARSGVPGSGSAAPKNAMIPKNTVYGNCGFSEFWILSTSTHGTARFFEVAYPYPAPIAYGSADISWHNLSKGGRQTFTDLVTANTNGWDWTHNDYRNTKTGIVFGTMWGDVFLTNGLICAIDYPSDTHTVT